MQMELIETFLDLCETRSFNRTAEQMGVTQSTVSGRIQALERALGCRLFVRSRAGTRLTTEGLRFEPHARSLRRSWIEALNATRDRSAAALTLRIGIQQDLVIDHVGDWIGTLRAVLPEAALYVEADFSAQISSDVISGEYEIGIIYTPKPHPDLHFETLGEVTYRMVSTDVTSIAEVSLDSYILPNFSPAFSRVHAALLPNLSSAKTASGQNAIVAGLVSSLGGATYVLDATARELVAAGHCSLVRDAPTIDQSVYAVIHLRNRHRTPFRRMVQLIRQQVSGVSMARSGGR